jgi:hypothetical protein
MQLSFITMTSPSQKKGRLRGGSTAKKFSGPAVLRDGSTPENYPPALPCPGEALRRETLAYYRGF